ncbi:hypothetical protein V475_07945 [Sphingobium baderi LL03]|uniref:Uncharacterized protein n=3 Tax=Sphingomonadaceae TaxID=41297 RepID=T0HVZ9_9SPHN|nr:hypothetical protein L485_06140 [Sphingobium baderi LL03]KMS62648.1 hypothetical protein V475_07945 [Sphingobium baderi LL03]TWH92826.1 hypothetical protein IQ35_02487 [Sphingobium wenxiniae]
MRFVFTHSHAFPGGRVAPEDDGGVEPGCLVEFGDGVTVLAQWRQEGADMVLDIPGYRTAKGAMIEPRRWRLVQDVEGIWRSRRISGN